MQGLMPANLKRNDLTFLFLVIIMAYRVEEEDVMKFSFAKVQVIEENI